MVFAAICQALDAGIDDATTREHGCVAVRNLTVGLDVSVRVCSVRTVAVAIGAADRVVAAMRRHPLNAPIAEHGCAALRNPAAAPTTWRRGGSRTSSTPARFEVAAEALNRVAATQVKVLEEGAAVIANATAGSGADARKAAAADAGCVDAAVTAMRKVTGGAAAVKGDAAAVAVLEVACTVLLNVCSGAAAEPHPRKEAAIEARACESLAVALGAGVAEEPPLALAATCALLTIANGEGAAAGARAQAAVDAGCLAPLAAAMGAHADIAAMAEVGCKALYALTVGSAERQAAAVAAGCTKAVVAARTKFGAETTARAWPTTCSRIARRRRTRWPPAPKRPGSPGGGSSDSEFRSHQSSIMLISITPLRRASLRAYSSALTPSTRQRAHTCDSSSLLSLPPPSSHHARRISLNAALPCSRSSLSSCSAFAVASGSLPASPPPAAIAFLIFSAFSREIACSFARSSFDSVLSCIRQRMHTCDASTSGLVDVQYHSCIPSISFRKRSRSAVDCGIELG